MKPTLISACQQSLDLIDGLWGLRPPPDCRVYLMNSWFEFMLRSAPTSWRVLMLFTFPLWIGRIRTLWRYAGGWSQRYGSRYAVGIKLPNLLIDSGDSPGRKIFLDEKNETLKFGQVLCHELMHACTTSLNLPVWLNEGLAMVTVDEFSGRPTVRKESLTMLDTDEEVADPASTFGHRREESMGTLMPYVRGYWTTRFLAETQNEFLVRLLGNRSLAEDATAQVANKLHIAPDAFWSALLPILNSYFNS